MAAQKMIQLHLGASQGILTVVKPIHEIYLTSPSRLAQITPPQKAYISMLPHELLFAIIEAADSFVAWERIRMLSYSLVSRAFHGIATELLYRKVELRFMQTSKSTALLYRSLMANQNLGRHIRQIDAGFEFVRDAQEAKRMVGEAIEILASFMELAPLTQSVTVHPGLVDRIHAELPTIIKLAPVKLPNLQQYYLRGCLGSYIHSIDCFEVLTRATRLETLNISADMYYTGQRPALPDLLERAASFTTLHIYDCYDGLEAAAQLIRWPQALRHVKIEAQAGYGYKTTLNQLFNALAIHHSSLETIDIGYMDDKIGPGIDLSHFIALRKLTMSRWSFRDAQLESCPSLARGILAPELKEFVWEFNVNEQSQPWPMALNESCIAWIHKFGQFAAEQHAKLNRIVIRFEPEWYGDWGSYPWEALGPVKRDLASCGIELHFESSVASKEAYEKVAQGLRDDAARWEHSFLDGNDIREYFAVIPHQRIAINLH
ncbi:hypothetical protein VHEMI04028 [[Torrubiella] hemipterigena]|uniref:F-box domain-containing protein n=1 Tax=[Torrubiella] hemipterigena TaxID=1531966 RepID=A0A0A1SU57_9HYPO|nr:hypothetical protein VHEMI04028 [[Torrubiella] hemipterigena]